MLKKNFGLVIVVFASLTVKQLIFDDSVQWLDNIVFSFFFIFFTFFFDWANKPYDWNKNKR